MLHSSSSSMSVQPTRQASAGSRWRWFHGKLKQSLRQSNRPNEGGCTSITPARGSGQRAGWPRVIAHLGHPRIRTSRIMVSTWARGRATFCTVRRGPPIPPIRALQLHRFRQTSFPTSGSTPRYAGNEEYAFSFISLLHQTRKRETGDNGKNRPARLLLKAVQLSLIHIWSSR